MPELQYQAMLFDVRAEFTHWFYGFTDGLVDKVGMTTDIKKRPKGDGQFKGKRMAWLNACGCALPVIDGDTKCERELAWESDFAASRLPRSELYRRTEDVRWAERYHAGNDQWSHAVLDWADRNRLGVTA